MCTSTVCFQITIASRVTTPLLSIRVSMAFHLVLESSLPTLRLGYVIISYTYVIRIVFLYLDSNLGEV